MFLSMQAWRNRARQLKTEVYALYLAYRDPRVPWYAKFVVVCVVGYAFSPIDLIPDFIPVLGYLDDLLLVPLGIALAIKLIPSPILAECRQEAQAVTQKGRPTNKVAAAIIVAIWVLLAGLVLLQVMRILNVELDHSLG